MGKKERKAADRQTRDEQARQRERATSFTAGEAGRRGDVRARGDVLRGGVEGRLTTAADEPTGGFDATELGRTRSRIGGIADTGGYDDRAEGLRSRFQARQTTGGVDPGQLEKIRRAQGAPGGGYDPESLGTLRTGYKGFIDTGGISDTEAGQFRRRATSGVPAIYNVLGQEAERRRSATGGIGPGGEISQMARQLSQRQAEASTGAEADLAAERRTGRMAGLGGLSNLEGDVAAGSRGQARDLASTEFGVSDRSARALEGETGLEGDIAAGRRAGAGMGANFETGVAGLRQREQLHGLGGLQDLLMSDNADDMAYGREILSSMGLDAGTQEALLKMLQQSATAPGLYDNILHGAAAASGVAQGAAGLRRPHGG